MADTATAIETTLDRAYHWEAKLPNRNYMVQPMGGGRLKELTWKLAMDEARRMATHLKSLDLPAKSHIAIFSKNTAWWILSDLAIQMAGHVSIPLYPTLGPDTIQYVLEHSESKLIFIGKLDGYEAMAPGIPEGLPRIALPLAPHLPDEVPTWEGIIAKTEPMSGKTQRDPDEMATIVYTSGSTGKPKGVMLTFRGMATAANEVGPFLNINESDRMLSYLPLAHVFERWLVGTCSVYWGFHVFFAESLDTFVDDLQRASPTLFVSVPRLWLKFNQKVMAKLGGKAALLKVPLIGGLLKKKILKGLGLQHVRFAGSGSAPIPPELIQWYRDLGLELLEGYGMSENFAYSHISRPGESRVGYVGHPMPAVEQRISDEGEIQIKSPANMLGYYKNEEKSKEAFTGDGWLKTGDRGEIDSAGRLRITGRVKELFKTSKGKYVAPAPIENKLLTHPDIELCCVTGSGQPQPHAIAMLAEGSERKPKDDVIESISEHLADVNKTLDHHEQLGFVTVVGDSWQIENGFLTPTMKLKRAKVEDTYGPKADGWYDAKQKVIWEA